MQFANGISVMDDMKKIAELFFLTIGVFNGMFKALVFNLFQKDVKYLLNEIQAAADASEYGSYIFSLKNEFKNALC